MLLRRDLLAGVGALCVAPALARAAEPLTTEDVKLDTLLVRQFNETVDENPELATSLGLDKSPNRAALRFKLADRSPERVARERTDVVRRLHELEGIDRARLSPASALTYDIADHRLQGGAQMAERFHFGVGAGGGRPNPYAVTQLSGAYASVPEFLTSAHRIETKDDAEAYLSRLNAFATALDQETEVVRHDAGLGVVAPDFVLAKAAGNLAILRDTPPDQNAMVLNLVKKAGAKGLGDYSKAAVDIVSGPVASALARQAAALKELQLGASSEAGVWRLPDGAAYYDGALVANTTVKITGEEVHRLGLAQVAELQARLDTLLAAQGLSQGSIGQRVAALNADPRHLFADTDAGKAECLAYLNELVAQMKPRLPKVFSVLPKADLEIQRVPAFLEAGAPLGYYTAAPIDNSRPGIYHINLKSTADWPKWGLPTLSYHEGIPGHHLQNSVSREHGELPIYRRAVGNFAGYGEGWALYAEQLADEIGAYDDNPLGRIGYVQSLLFRAVRLVTDSGLHVKRWSRDQAIRYMMDNCGRTEGASTNEIERYCVWPGQACSYKLGHTVITRLRSDAKAKQGDRFDLKAFHETVLMNGSLPLPVLETVVSAWAAKARQAEV
jgi:uncharacterized protein (DUF885 family)